METIRFCSRRMRKRKKKEKDALLLLILEMSHFITHEIDQDYQVLIQGMSPEQENQAKDEIDRIK